MIEASHLTKEFGSIRAIDDVTFTSPKGEIAGRERRLRVGASTSADNLMYVKFVDEAGVLKIGVELRFDVDRVSEFAERP